MALVLSLGLLIPASLGRCDGGHVFANGVGIFIIFLALAFQLKDQLLSRLLGGLYMAFFLAAGMWAYFGAYDIAVKDAIRLEEEDRKYPWWIRLVPQSGRMGVGGGEKSTTFL